MKRVRRKNRLRPEGLGAEKWGGGVFKNDEGLRDGHGRA